MLRPKLTTLVLVVALAASAAAQRPPAVFAYAKERCAVEGQSEVYLTAAELGVAAITASGRALHGDLRVGAEGVTYEPECRCDLPPGCDGGFLRAGFDAFPIADERGALLPVLLVASASGGWATVEGAEEPVPSPRGWTSFDPATLVERTPEAAVTGSFGYAIWADGVSEAYLSFDTLGGSSFALPGASGTGSVGSSVGMGTGGPPPGGPPPPLPVTGDGRQYIYQGGSLSAGGGFAPRLGIRVERLDGEVLAFGDAWPEGEPRPASTGPIAIDPGREQRLEIEALPTGPGEASVRLRVRGWNPQDGGTVREVGVAMDRTRFRQHRFGSLAPEGGATPFSIDDLTVSLSGLPLLVPGVLDAFEPGASPWDEELLGEVLALSAGPMAAASPVGRFHLRVDLSGAPQPAYLGTVLSEPGDRLGCRFLLDTEAFTSGGVVLLAAGGAAPGAVQLEVEVSGGIAQARGRVVGGGTTPWLAVPDDRAEVEIGWWPDAASGEGRLTLWLAEAPQLAGGAGGPPVESAVVLPAAGPWGSTLRLGAPLGWSSAAGSIGVDDLLCMVDNPVFKDAVPMP